MSGTNHSEIQALIDVSARLGRDPLLVQAGSGNTSVKIDGVLWIKASGKWLAHAAPRDRVIGLRLEGRSWDEIGRELAICAATSETTYRIAELILAQGIVGIFPTPMLREPQEADCLPLRDVLEDLAEQNPLKRTLHGPTSDSKPGRAQLRLVRAGGHADPALVDQR